jgi:hypothetical protein
LVKLAVEEKRDVQVIHKPDAETLKAIEDAEKGKTEKVSLTDFRKQLY